MSFINPHALIEEGDTVIVYISFTNLHVVEVKSKILNKHNVYIENVMQTAYGALKIADLVGKPYGSRVTLSKGWAYVLYPTPELWTLTLSHRTQILYTPDISLILTYLELKPGSNVCEAGTGSGSLTHALARTVAPTGHVYTFDFHCERIQTAKEEFVKHAVADLITVQQRDICVDGFGLENIADAVFLDVPNPWNGIWTAKAALKVNEQVQKTCAALRSSYFLDVKTIECVLRELQIRHITLPIVNSEELQEETLTDADVSPIHTDTGSACAKKRKKKFQ